MKVHEILAQSQKTLFSFELLPPLKGQNADKLYQTIEGLTEFDPQYINITTHRDEVAYKEVSQGLLEKRYVRKRPGTLAIAAAIQHRYDIPVVPHLVCGGYTKEETENMLIDLNFLGIENVLALRGDGLKSETLFRPEAEGHANANELVEQIINLRQGKYLDEGLKNHTPLDFSIGVAGYPEKHFESPNLDLDLHYLKQKVDAGADYIVTQLFYDNQKYFDFVKRCRDFGITVPIIPGLKPLTRKNQLSMLAKVFSIDLPQDLVKAVMECKNDQEAKQVGSEWAIQQSRELVAAGVPSLHLYTYGLDDNIRAILKAVF